MIIFSRFFDHYFVAVLGRKVEPLAVRHTLRGTIGLPLQARLYVRRRSVGTIPEKYGWRWFREKFNGSSSD